MASEMSGGFGWGIAVGLVIGVAAGAYLASGPAREHVDGVRLRTVELTRDPENPVRRILSEGVAAARRAKEAAEGNGAEPSVEV